MSIIDLILPKTAVPRKRPQSYLARGPYRYCSKLNLVFTAVIAIFGNFVEWRHLLPQ